MARCSIHAALALLLGVLTFAMPPSARAATGCALTNPEDDLRGFFPSMSDFSTRYLTFQAQAPQRHALVSKALGDELDAVYETPDVPYTLYSVRSRGTVLGYVFGANQRGTYSNIQVIAVTDDKLDLQQVYLQKIRSPAWRAFRAEAFSSALAGEPLESYPRLADCYVRDQCDGVQIADPSEGKERGDFRSVLRALAKLHLLSQALLEPGVERSGRDDQARAERVTSWWTDQPMGSAIDAPRWSTIADAPWRDDDPCLVWRGQGGGVIVPLAVLALHRVVLATVADRSMAFTWSPRGGTAVVLERPRGARLEPTGELLHGVALFTSSDDRSQWSSALGAAVRGPAVGDVTRIAAGPVITSYGQARRVTPQAKVVLPPARDDPATLRTIHESLEALRGDDHVTVVAVGHQRHAFRQETRTPGLRRAHVAGRDVVVLFDGALRVAFEESLADSLLYLGRAPFGGLPLLWSPQNQCLYEGVTGGVLHGPDDAVPLEPVASYTMEAGAYGALHPASPLEDVTPD